MRDEERILYCEGSGYVSFKRTCRAKRLIIRVRHDGQVKVTVPYSGSFRNAVSFVEKKTGWIVEMKRRLDDKNRKKLIFGEGMEFNTPNHKLLIKRYSGKLIRTESVNGEISIQVPESEDILSSGVQDRIRKMIIETWRVEAKAVLVKRTCELAGRYHFQVSGVKIKNMRTRWGSCSRHNIINLNLHIIRLPEHLTDYIILHELVHTEIKNHSYEFWNRLNQLTVDARKYSRELRGMKFDFNLEYSD